MSVKPKKHLGQHFLTDDSISFKIADSLKCEDQDAVLEIGPGTGVLTRFLVEENYDLLLCEIDGESVEYLHENFPELKNKILHQDFLQIDLSKDFSKPIHIIGNFPYNISTQILFKVFENREIVPQVVGMFQKEVAKRIASGPGNKQYGILSVLLQAFYDIEYLFSVPPESFFPVPRVESGVIRLVRNNVKEIKCSTPFFKVVVKTAFNQRRKTLSNALKPLIGSMDKSNIPYLSLRAEQLTVGQFEELAVLLENHKT